MPDFFISEPSTVYLKNLSRVNRAEVFLHGLKLPYFFRDLGGKFEHIQINLCHAGQYSCNCGEIEKITPIEISPLELNLPSPDRDRIKPYTIKFNKELTGSPARNFTKSGIIEIGTRFFLFPYPIRVFILLHEIGHFYYKDEINCDLFAANEFIKMGYNNSTAMYALTKVLNCNSALNQNRIETLFKNLKK